MDTTRKKEGLEWYHWSILVTGIIYTLMNTTFVIINAYTCINWDSESDTVLYNISYDRENFKDPCIANETSSDNKNELPFVSKNWLPFLIIGM